MKNSAIFFALSLFVFASCDKVKDPVENKNVAIGTNFITNSNAARAHFKKVLIEDYTGHQCGNCPKYAELAHNLSVKYQDTVIAIAVHAGNFANVNTEYPTSYTCTAGNDWNGPTGFAIPGYPNGMVNRKVYTGYTLVHKVWDETVPIAKNDPFVLKLDVTTNYDPTARALNADVKGTFNSSHDKDVHLSVVLIEDSIVGPQKDYRQTPDLVEEYEFEHMLRVAVNGSWGEEFKALPINSGDTIRKSYQNFALDTKFNDKHVYLVAFAFNGSTREVLQVEKVKIR